MYKHQTLIISLNFTKVINLFFKSDWLIIILSGSVFSKLKYINSKYNSFYAKILIHVIVLFSIKEHMQFYMFILPAVESMLF